MNRLDVEERQGEKLIECFSKSASDIAAQPGFVRFDSLTPPDEENTYIAQTDGELEENFERWTDSGQFRNVHRDDSVEEQPTSDPTLETAETAVLTSERAREAAYMSNCF